MFPFLDAAGRFGAACDATAIPYFLGGSDTGRRGAPGTRAGRRDAMMLAAAAGRRSDQLAQSTGTCVDEHTLRVPSKVQVLVLWEQPVALPASP